jgi:hypothetical protein
MSISQRKTYSNPYQSQFTFNVISKSLRLCDWNHIMIWQYIFGMTDWVNEIACQSSQDSAEGAEKDQKSHACPGSRRNEPAK